MNTKQKASVNEIKNRVEDLLQDLEDLESEQQTAFDALSAKSQEGKRGEKISTAIDQLQDAKGFLGEAIEPLEKLMED